MSQRGDADAGATPVTAGWGRGFSAWSAAGFLVAGALLSAASIGLFLMPVAVVVMVLVARTCGFGPVTFGLLGGVGAALLGVALLTAGETSSACSGISQLGPGQTGSVTCGPRLSPARWVVAGAVCWGVAVAGAVGMSTLRRGPAGRHVVGGGAR